MKKFLFFCLKIIFVLIAVAVLADFFYTFVFSKSTNRFKVEHIINTKSEKYDVVILGSSRANNHFNAQLFKARNLKAFNFGMSGSSLQESALMLQLMIENNFEIKNIIIEIDLNINSEKFSEGTRARFIPFLTSSKVVSNYYKPRLLEFNLLNQTPFYRYIKYDSQIGIREVFFIAINKPASSMQNLGFYPLNNVGKNLQYDLTGKYPKRNINYEFIKLLCFKNNINLIAVTTPICQNTKNKKYFDEIKYVYPEIHNCENFVKSDKYFSSCGHMNADGAKVFTNKIIDNFFK